MNRPHTIACVTVLFFILKRHCSHLKLAGIAEGKLLGEQIWDTGK